ncbi:MAG: hydrogenase nickel incorporation protein HypB [Oscillospiraceae bacterium]|jgi:hydrogenase nickel incorporation protein HypB|nr:hydrogenase nickel incorporation protein HypB [Oscillospiraceae bacterium]
MDNVRILEIKKSVYENNDLEAGRLRERLKKEKTCLMNLMSSPGSGKTTTLLRTIEALRDRFRIGVMEADIDSAVDAEIVAAAGTKAIQLHTGGMCHLDAGMTESGIDEFGTEDLDFVVLENVGNLVCPAEFDTGASFDVMLLSVPEGDDKPLKYPLMFSKVSALLINKIDVKPYFDFDANAVRERVKRLNPDIAVFEISAKTGEGIEEWADWLAEKIRAWNA